MFSYGAARLFTVLEREDREAGGCVAHEFADVGCGIAFDVHGPGWPQAFSLVLVFGEPGETSLDGRAGKAAVLEREDGEAGGVAVAAFVEGGGVVALPGKLTLFVGAKIREAPAPVGMLFGEDFAGEGFAFLTIHETG